MVKTLLVRLLIPTLRDVAGMCERDAPQLWPRYGGDMVKVLLDCV